MDLGAARAVAADWVERHAADRPGFVGAYLAGSTVGLPPGTPLPDGSDVDVMVVTTDHAASASKIGKLRHGGVLLDVTLVPWEEISSPADVLAAYHLAAGLRTNAVVADPTGQLRAVQAEVGRRFAERQWVRRRCEDVRNRITTRLAAIDPTTPWHQQVMTWLFGVGVTAHLVLVAALRNPTVRLRYLAAREVLDEYGHAGRYEQLLELLRCADLSPERVERHVRRLGDTFDAAAAASRSAFPFSSDITPQARPIAIDASLRLVRDGWHREVVFWTVATYARCHWILATDAPDTERALRPAFADMLADLRIASTDDLLAGADAVAAAMPDLWASTEAIMKAHPEIR